MFTQSSLSRHLSPQGRAEDKAKHESSANALSLKRWRIVTRPDIEQMLILWTRHLWEKGEMPTGAMLMVKRAWFEKEVGVPEDERMQSDGWLPGFCRT